MTPHARFRFRDLDDLLQTARTLGVDLPASSATERLLQPVMVAGRLLANRFVIHPMEGCDADSAGRPGELTTRRYTRFATGGSGMIWLEATAVCAEGRSNPHQLLLTPKSADAFARLVDRTRQAARAAGRVLSPVLILQLTHAGRYARGRRHPGAVIAQHNPILDPAAGLAADYPLISDDELDRLQETFVAAAGLAAGAGFDGVDIKACHGYLVSELLGAHTRQSSRYGGSFDARIRFLRATVQRILDALPGLLVTSRLSMWDGLPHPYGFGAAADRPNGLDLGEVTALVRILGSLGVPLLNLSLGNPHYRAHHGRPYDVPLVGAQPPEEHPLVGVGRLLRLTAALQRAVPSLPLVGTGYSWLRQFLPAIGAGVVASGGATLIGVGRNAFAYPDLVRDLETGGALHPDKVCLTCSRCSQIMRDGGRSGCVIRDGEIYGREYDAGRRKD